MRVVILTREALARRAADDNMGTQSTKPIDELVGRGCEVGEEGASGREVRVECLERVFVVVGPCDDAKARRAEPASETTCAAKKVDHARLHVPALHFQVDYSSVGNTSEKETANCVFMRHSAAARIVS
mmetsp:Transcript_660/g.1868  ORF Transcript_660/g.1868 Transcript_660/m.1868 type:complete len:128 (+) Transcript_660:220-603(+)